MTATLSLLTLCLLGTLVQGLPDFSKLVPDSQTTPSPESEDFVFSPFFQMYSGVPPITTISPVPPVISIPIPSVSPISSSEPKAPPTLVPTRSPAQQQQPATPTATPPPVPPPAPQPAPVVVSATRHMSYQYIWRGTTEGCTYKAPRTVLQCLDGGVLLVNKLSNAECEALALDVARCAQMDPGTNAKVEFDCVGITPRHLAVTTQTLPSEATDCAAPMGPTHGGIATAEASLGRFCKDPSTGDVAMDDSFSCTENDKGSKPNSTGAFCPSMNQCTGMNCTIEIEPIIITASNPDNACSEPETRQDLTNFQFNPSTLTSYHVVKWTFSDRAFKCDWQVPDIEISCGNGGGIQLIQNVPFCGPSSARDSIICTNPSPQSEEGRIIVELDFWCFGQSVDQLILDAKTLDVDPSGFVCEPGGLLVQGLDVSRGCGDLHTENFKMIKTPGFCKDLSQFRDNLCFAGFSCPAGTTDCTNVSVDSVEADSSNLVVGSCFFAEQIS